MSSFPLCMTVEQLQEKLSKYTPIQLQIKLNENPSTYLSVLERNRKKMTLSLHKLFLQANDNICEAIMRYSLFQEKKALQSLRIFTHTYFQQADHSHLVHKKKLQSKGKVYDLQKLYEKINQEYFQSKLNLNLTWFKKPKYKTFRSITFGSYNHTLRLIRINEIIDDIRAPVYFVEYILYHEMLHAVCESQISPYGKIYVHTPKFRKLEKKFYYYEEARNWEKENFQQKRRFRGWA